MVTVNAHFDGKVIVPEHSALAWLAENALEADTLPADLAAQLDHHLYGCPKKD
jgi:hypothetical protein